MQRNCPQCRRLWEAYYSAALDEFAWQERRSTAVRTHDPARMAELQPVVESAGAKATALRQEIVAHSLRHAQPDLNSSVLSQDAQIGLSDSP